MILKGSFSIKETVLKIMSISPSWDRHSEQTQFEYVVFDNPVSFLVGKIIPKSYLFLLLPISLQDHGMTQAGVWPYGVGATCDKYWFGRSSQSIILVVHHSLSIILTLCSYAFQPCIDCAYKRNRKLQVLRQRLMYETFSLEIRDIMITLLTYYI